MLYNLEKDTHMDNVLSREFSKFICTEVLERVSVYLSSNKNCNVSVSELCTALSLAQTTESTGPPSKVDFTNLGKLNIKPTERKPREAAKPTSNKVCEYILTRGQNQGKHCTGKVVGDASYCNACLKNKADKIKSLESNLISGKQEVQTKPLEISQLKDGNFYNPQNGLILHADPSKSGGYVSLGYVDKPIVNDEYTLLPLNEEKSKVCDAYSIAKLEVKQIETPKLQFGTPVLKTSDRSSNLPVLSGDRLKPTLPSMNPLSTRPKMPTLNLNNSVSSTVDSQQDELNENGEEY